MSGQTELRKKLRRQQALAFFSQLQPCVVAMEACGGAHFWGREIGKLGHEVRLIPPAYVKPFVKRQKNDAADAEAICEAAQRPTMRFVPVKSEETQGAAMVFRVRELLIRQRTQAINALRGHLTEFGQIVPQRAANASTLIAIVEDLDSGLPLDAIATLKVLVAALDHLQAEIGKLDAEIARRAKADEVARRLMTVPGIGPLIATAIAVLARPPETFRKARDFAGWLGLVPRQHSTGGKRRLGATTKMGERSLRRLLIIGANGVVIKRHTRAAVKPGTWLGGMLSRKPPMLVRVALANKMARIGFFRKALRQPNNSGADIPRRRASAETFTPGSSAAATACALNSSDHRRRSPTGAPSNRSITASTNCKLPVAGIGVELVVGMGPRRQDNPTSQSQTGHAANPRGLLAAYVGCYQRGDRHRRCRDPRRDRCLGRAADAGDPGGAGGGVVMLGQGGPVKVFVATRPVDFRKGIDGLALAVQEMFGLDPFSGAVFVLRSKRADRIKLLV